MINISNISKSYRNKKIIENMQLQLSSEDIVVIVGNNGIGKTTLLNLLMGYSKLSNGELDIEGNAESYKKWMAENALMMDEKIQHFCSGSLKKIIDIYQEFDKGFCKEECLTILETFELDTNAKYGKLSKGMRNQFNIALNVAQDKKVLILDEPCAGLDEMSRYNFADIIKNSFITRPRLILISTHMLGELKNIATKILLMTAKGQWLKDVTEVDGMLIKLVAPSDILTSIMRNKKIYAQQELGKLLSIIIDSDLNYAEKKYIKQHDIDVHQIDSVEVCRILCNNKNFEVSHEKNI